MVLQAMFFTGVMVSHSYWLTIACIFGIGTVAYLRVNVGFAYMSELVGAKYRTLYGTVWNISEGLIFIYATVYFWQISTQWFYFVSIGYAVQIASVIMCMFLPESPVFLLSKGRTDEAEESFQQIARWNKTEFTQDLSSFNASA